MSGMSDKRGNDELKWKKIEGRDEMRERDERLEGR